MTDNIITVRLFIDMDGTLAAWQQASCFEDLLQENYFRDLPPYQTVVDAVRILCNAHPELDIYALSAFMPENPAAVGEKSGWLDVYVPEIDAAHRIFVPCGNSKAAAAANRLKMPCMHAIALANTCDLRCRDTREERYKAIVQKYDEKTVQQFAVLTAITMTALLENPEQDFLGTVYHNLGLSKSQAGQFFTPYNVGQMMARINMPDSLVLDKSRILRVNDPCCGAGCLLLAGYNVMREQLESTDPDWDKYVLFVAQDIDPLACKMCYIQMCCIGVPGVVVVGNSLFPDAERAPTDFWFTHKYFALDEKALENTYQQTKE